MNTSKRTARIAGALYLLLGITGGFGIMYVSAAIFVPGDATTTIRNMMHNEFLFRLSIVANVICQVTFIFLALVLYRLFKQVDEGQARLLVSLVVASVPIAFVNILFEVMSVVQLSGVDFIKTMEQSKIDSIMMYLNLNMQGTNLVQVFWGLWLFPFGWLVIRSGFIPKIFGFLLNIACFGYLLNSITHLLFPTNTSLVSIAHIFTSVAGTVAEFAIIFWFLIKGVRET